MPEFFETLLNGWSEWGSAEWGFVVALLTYLGLDGKSGFKAARYVARGFKPEPEKISKVEVVQPKTQSTDLPPIRFGLPHIERQVRGRETELETLRAGLLSQGEAAIVNSGAVLQGQGGIGKTTLARHYVDKFGAEYDGIIWAVAENEGALAQTLMGLAPQLQLRLDNLAPVQAAQAVLTKLTQDERDWLVIYDNVTGFDTIRNLVPECHLIVTTRAAAGWDGFATLQADVLEFDTEEGAAVQVLMEAADRTEDAAGARELAEDLGGLPLALVVAGALIKSEGYEFAEYRDRIADVISHAPKNAAYPDSVIGAVKLSYDALPEDAQTVVDILAWWAPEGLTPDLLTAAPKGENWTRDQKLLSEHVIELVSDAGRVRAALQVLVDASLLIRESEAHRNHALHRMSGAALRALQSDEVPAISATALIAALFPNRIRNSVFWPACRILTPHVRALWETGKPPRVIAMQWLFNQAGNFLDTMADYEGGLALTEASFEIIQELLSESDKAYAAGLHNLALSRMTLGDLEGAERDMLRSVSLNEEHRPNSKDLSSSYNQMGFILEEVVKAGDVTRLQEAIRRYQQALALRRRLHGRESEPVAASLNNLASGRGLQGRLAAAARLYGASLNINRRVLPEGDARLAYGVVNTGATWLRSGRADLAEPLLAEALEIRRAAYVAEPSHPELLNAADWLMSCLLVRAAAGENAGLREMQARQLADEFGFDWDMCLKKPERYPYDPDAIEG